MTRQECVEQLEYAKFLILANDKDWLDARDIPILDMAIEALEKQVPIKEQCTICPHCNNCDVDENGNVMSDECSVKPKNTGYWRHYEMRLKCSKCNVEIYDDIMEFLSDNVPKYCPWCGADMRGDSNE